MLVTPQPGQATQPPLLAPRDRLERGTEGLGRARLHLAHHEVVAIAGDDVDLAAHAPPVAVEDGQAVGEQVAAGEAFAVVAEGTGGEVHADHPRGTRSGSTGLSVRLWTAYVVGEGVWTADPPGPGSAEL